MLFRVFSIQVGRVSNVTYSRAQQVHGVATLSRGGETEERRRESEGG